MDNTFNLKTLCAYYNVLFLVLLFVNVLQIVKLDGRCWVEWYGTSDGEMYDTISNAQSCTFQNIKTTLI